MTVLRIVFLLSILITGGCGDREVFVREQHPLPEDVEIVKDIVPGKYGGVFVTAGSQPPKTFHPMLAEDAYSSEAIGPVVSRLTTVDPKDMSRIPELAKSWEVSEDNLTYTFYLRRGVRWSDGMPFSADDVMFTYDVIFDDRYPNRLAHQYTINGERIQYRKIDDYTVEFTTPKVYAPFINDISYAAILPKHVFEESAKNGTFQKKWSLETATERPEEIVGTGPFLVDEFRDGERIVYKPNPHYWRADEKGQRLPYIDRVITKYVPDVNTQYVLFASGQTDVAPGYSPISLRDLVWIEKGAEAHGFKMYPRGEDPGISFIFFNQKPGVNEDGKPYLPPHKLRWFTDRNFRQAISYAIDREGIIQANYSGDGVALYSIISGADKKWHNPNAKKYPYDVEKARALLKKSGFWYDGNGRLRDRDQNLVEIEHLVSEGSERAATTAATVQENLKDIGISFKVMVLDFATLIDRVNNTANYESAQIGFTGGGDPSGGKAMYRSDGRLHLWNPEQEEPATEWEARVDAIMDAQESEMDEPKRIALIHEMQEIFSEEVPMIMLTNPNYYSGLKTHWQNVKLYPIVGVSWNLDEFWTNGEESDLLGASQLTGV